MGEAWDSYPVPDTFSENVSELRALSRSQLSSATQLGTADPQQRKHAACDECRKRKLKCSGEPAGCSRCIKNAIPCVYSQQKQMGRPRKRQKVDGESNSPGFEEVRDAQPATLSSQTQHTAQADVEPQMNTLIDPSLANIDQDLTDFHNVCNGPMAQTIRNQRNAAQLGVSTVDNTNVFAQDGGAVDHNGSSTQYPTDISLWPDFSTMDQLPLPLTTKFDPDPANDVYYTGLSTASTAASDTARLYQDPDVDPAALASLPSIPACPCLPNLYLALSTLSTLTSFPVAQHTIETLLSAHKTAHSVIYCSVCPQQFQSGSQNLMLSCTLLNVLADAWHRVRKSTPEALKKGFGVSSTKNSNYSQQNGNGVTTTTTHDSFIGVKEGLAWRNFARQLIRAYVFGDAGIPIPPQPTKPSAPIADPSGIPTGPKVTPSSTLHFLISALERRQRQWHRVDEPTDEFADRPQYEHYHNHGLGTDEPQPRSIIEEAGKWYDHPTATSSATNTTHETDSATDRDTAAQRSRGYRCNGDGSGGGGGGDAGGIHNHNRPSYSNNPETMLCLMIVKHGKEIVQMLGND